MKRSLLLFLVVFALFTLAIQAAPLTSGDPAPELKVSKWIKGGPVEGLDPAKTYVVEFWATWCGPCRSSIPHLTKLAQAFSNVTFIGMNVWERDPNADGKVTQFVTDMGDKMDYAVARDTADGFMASNWMEAAEQGGIPTAFLVHQGQVIWIGHPLAGLEEALQEVSLGSFNVENAKKRSEVQKRVKAFYQKASAGADEAELAEEGQALEALDAELGGIGIKGQKFVMQEVMQQVRFGIALRAYQEALFSESAKADLGELEAAARAAAPDDVNFDELNVKIQQYASQVREEKKSQGVLEKYFKAVGAEGEPEQAAALAQQMEAQDIQDPDILNEIAWSILTDEKVKQRDLPLATRLAKKAVDATQEKRGDILDTYARALFDAGQMAEALESQKKAVALDPANLELTMTLSKYMDAARPGGPALALRTERFGALAFAAGKSIYVLGGHSDHGIVGTIERFDANSKQTEMLSPLVLPRRFHAGAAYGGKFYFTGGVTLRPDSEAGVTLVNADGFEEFDPATRTVRQLPAMPMAVSRAGAVVVGHRLYFIGGAQDERDARTQAVQIYDFKTETWSRGADMPLGREGEVFEYGGKIYAPGGYNGTEAIRDFQVYDPAKNKWSELPPLPVKMSAHHGMVLGKTLYTFGDYDVLERTAAYDFKKKTWALLDLGYQPSRHATVAQLGKKVFVIGGNVRSGPPYLSRIQSFTARQLAKAPRQAWKSAAE